MGHGTRRQKDKKNKNRPKAGDIGFKSSIQKRSYAKIKPIDKGQKGLF